MLASVKVGEWQGIGRARALVTRHLGELQATELATHVTLNLENGRQRILVATDLGLLDYNYSKPEPNSPIDNLRGTLHRWTSVRAFRLQADAQWDEGDQTARSVWRLVADEPRVELLAESAEGDRAAAPLLEFARACLAQLEG